jgi:hypothetical protein
VRREELVNETSFVRLAADRLVARVANGEVEVERFLDLDGAGGFEGVGDGGVGDEGGEEERIL